MKSIDFDFTIKLGGVISEEFLALRIGSFKEAVNYIKTLPYGRNTDKQNLISVFRDMRGTCSTKHAILCELAIENRQPEVSLMLGIFKMNTLNTPKIAVVLSRYNLPYILEAHNYLSIRNSILDCTNPDSSADDFVADLLVEKEISPFQITEYKVAFHQDLLKEWLANQSEVKLSLPELWTIREECIQALSA